MFSEQLLLLDLRGSPNDFCHRALCSLTTHLKRTNDKQIRFKTNLNFTTEQFSEEFQCLKAAQQARMKIRRKGEILRHQNRKRAEL